SPPSDAPTRPRSHRNRAVALSSAPMSAVRDAISRKRRKGLQGGHAAVAVPGEVSDTLGGDDSVSTIEGVPFAHELPSSESEPPSLEAATHTSAPSKTPAPGA